MVSITIRNVPDSVHQRLTAHADELGVSLQAYLLQELDRIASLRPMPLAIADAERRLARAKTTLTVQEILSAVHADRK